MRDQINGMVEAGGGGSVGWNTADPSETARHDFQRLKTRFLSGLNHEMRTPLTGIMGIVDLMRETPLTAEQQEYVSIVRSCAESLHEILNATLELASLSSGQVRREQAPFALKHCLQSLADEYGRKAQARGLELRYQTSGHVPDVVIGDEIRVRVLLAHLMANAVKFTEQGGIEINVMGKGDPEGQGPCWLDIEVRDTGIGIAPGKLGRIFESFEQADESVDSDVRQYAGLGLGLALVREYTHLLDGEITVESALGSGSVFRVRLPVHPTHEHAPSKPMALAAMPMIVPGRPRVLLVEDNRVSQRIVSHMLTRASFESVAVDNGMDAVRAAADSRFDLVLMDLHLPGIDGIETAYRLRRLPGYAETPVVALTANAGAEYRELCRKHGLQGFLSKPVQAEEMLRTIEECLSLNVAAA